MRNQATAPYQVGDRIRHSLDGCKYEVTAVRHSAPGERWVPPKSPVALDMSFWVVALDGKIVTFVTDDGAHMGDGEFEKVAS